MSASTVRASVEGVRALEEALRELGDGSERMVGGAIQAAAQPIAGRARQLTPRGPGPRATARNPNDRLPHVADTIFATAHGRAAAAIVARHPAAGLIEYGGSIQPRGPATQPIVVAAHAMAHRAADEQLEAVERDLEARLDALAASVGLT